MAINTPQAGDLNWGGTGGLTGKKLNATLNDLDALITALTTRVTNAENAATALTTRVTTTEGEIDALQAQPSAMLRQTTNQSLSSGSFTAITFTTEDWDTHSGHSNSSNTSRYTVQTGWAGKYEFAGGVSIAVSGTEGRGTLWKKNGTDINGGQSMGGNAGTTLNTLLVARTIQVQLAVGDYVELYGYHNSGGSLNTIVGGNSDQSFMSVKCIGP